MPYSTLTLHVADRIATITVNRPDKLNALNAAVIAELEQVVAEVRRRDDIAGALLTGAGRAFVAGADIAELSELRTLAARGQARQAQRIFRDLERLPKPVIAAVNGFALGGGCELAMACHVRIAAEGARFGQPEVKLGLCAGYGGTQRLPRLVGRGRALQLLLTGEIIDAPEALRIGLVNRVVPGDALLATATDMLRLMIANAPLALAASIEAVNRGLEGSLDDGLELEADLFAMLCDTRDAAEGTQAFLEKRPATFTGA
jgi:enoyl-CoA hydratase